ncbi:uncharacterized protein LOC130813455 [Amaranthus tricolor]|uniref:uncharacterized protein LOC130813455 n=1 Tax=Amaranthus tricolor TaxID=29722 RepID=UPI00258A1E6B|nr:uncharacterized protein LOC130813455 [Amaranthus tricolor]
MDVVSHCFLVEMEIEKAGCSQTVRMKVELKKECQFGDSFLIVGDDPILGSWNPSHAIPLNWSEGHIWSLLLELPVGKSIQYKILLKKQTGEILWQPGSDRSIQTWDTENVITVTEDWDTAEAQQISEDEQISDENEEVTNRSLVLASILDSSKNDKLDRVPKDNFSGAEDKTEVHLKQNSSSHTVKNGSNSVRSTQRKVSAFRKSNEQKGKADTKEGNFVIADEGPVLVPGLSLPVSSSEDDFANGNQKSTHFNIH